VAYQALHVASYDWYYAPLLPAAAALGGLGVAWLARRLAPAGDWRRSALAAALAAPVLLAALASHRAFAAAGPDPRLGLYQRAGDWLAANTPPEARVGVMEVGVIGYYARRPMVDFLGLLRPETVAALRHGDVFWTLGRYQPDYLVLSEVYPLWGYPLQADPWFHAAYRPVAAFADPAYWGKQVTVYRRALPEPGPMEDRPAAATFGDTLRLRSYAAPIAPGRAGGYLTLYLRWQLAAPRAGPVGVSAQLLAPGPAVVAQADLPTDLGAWPAGEPVEFVHLLALPPALPPASYTLYIAVYDPDRPSHTWPATGETGGYRDGAAVGTLRVE